MQDRSESSWGARAAAVMLVALAVLCVGLPALAVARQVAREAAHGGIRLASLIPSWGLLASTLGWALGIGVLSTVLGLPAAWWIGRRGWSVAPFAAAPLLLPTYLAYTAFGLLRAPRSLLGDWIEERAQAGAEWLPVFAGRVVAAVGLSCWGWGIAALVLAAGVRSLPRDALDAIELDRASRPRRGWHLARMLRGHLAMATGAVGLVMIGSAVPLHLANAPTYSVRVWYELSLAPGSARAWASSWPLLATAGLAAWLLARRLGAGPRSPDSVAGVGGAGRAAAVGTAAVAALGVVVPWVLLATTVGSVQNLMNFWALSGEAFVASAIVASGVGVASAAISLCVWVGLSSFDVAVRAAVKTTMAIWLFGAFVPGVLVGQAVASAWGWRPSLLDSPVVIALGHLARFGAVAGLLGCWLAAGESRPAREHRRMDGATGLFGFVRAVAPGRWLGILGAGLVCACLSLHEIETSVFLQPPGIPSLAQTLLGYLHYSRMADLSAAAVWMVGLGVVLAGVCAAVLAKSSRVSRLSAASR